MFIRLFLLFIGVPILEIYTLLQVGHLLGVFPTVALVLLTGISGAYLAHTQGLELLRRIEKELAGGRMPAETLLDGLMVLVGGILLLTPGLWTDLLGFSLLVPWPRAQVKRWLKSWLAQRIGRGEIRFQRIL